MKSSRVLIKLGGASLHDQAVMETLKKALVEYRRYDYQVILVHGGGPFINTELTQRGIPWSFIDGQRVTTPEMMDVIEMVLCGKINRKLVAEIESAGAPAISFAASHGSTFHCQQLSPHLGRVGAVTAIDRESIERVLSWPGNPIPVIAPIGHGAQGETFNINADWAASHLAVALGAEYLIYLTDQNGVLNEEQKLIQNLPTGYAHDLIHTGGVTGGMLTKMQSILYALENGVHAVRIMNGRDAISGLWSDFIGTWCYQEFPQDLLRTNEEGDYVYA